MCVYVCVCVRARARERESEREEVGGGLPSCLHVGSSQQFDGWLDERASAVAEVRSCNPSMCHCTSSEVDPENVITTV
jgi:hypothetical protein